MPHWSDPICGSARSTTSPFISNTNRETPWAAGCWGPKFKVKFLICLFLVVMGKKGRNKKEIRRWGKGPRSLSATNKRLWRRSQCSPRNWNTSMMSSLYNKFFSVVKARSFLRGWFTFVALFFIRVTLIFFFQNLALAHWDSNPTTYIFYVFYRDELVNYLSILQSLMIQFLKTGLTAPDQIFMSKSCLPPSLI